MHDNFSKFLFWREVVLKKLKNVVLYTTNRQTTDSMQSESIKTFSPGEVETEKSTEHKIMSLYKL